MQNYIEDIAILCAFGNWQGDEKNGGKGVDHVEAARDVTPAVHRLTTTDVRPAQLQSDFGHLRSTNDVADFI